MNIKRLNITLVIASLVCCVAFGEGLQSPSGRDGKARRDIANLTMGLASETANRIASDSLFLPLAGGSMTGNILFNPSCKIFAASGSIALPGITFSDDPNTGITQNGADTLLFSTGGAYRAQCTALGFMSNTDVYCGSSNVGAAMLRNCSVSGTVPNFTWASNLNSGLGRYSLGQPSMVASGSEIQRWTNSGVTIYTNLTIASATYVATPTLDTQAANKGYVDSLATLKPEYSTVTTTSTTTFNLSFSYTPGNKEIMVFAGGLVQRITTDYLESSSTLVTFTSAIGTGTTVQFIKR